MTLKLQVFRSWKVSVMVIESHKENIKKQSLHESCKFIVTHAHIKSFPVVSMYNDHNVRSVSQPHGLNSLLSSIIVFMFI